MAKDSSSPKASTPANPAPITTTVSSRSRCGWPGGRPAASSKWVSSWSRSAAASSTVFSPIASSAMPGTGGAEGTAPAVTARTS